MEVTLEVPGIGLFNATEDQPLPVQYRLICLEKPDERQMFWRNVAQWPSDRYGQVFLANAITQLGSAIFGDQWTGFEPTVDLRLKELPSFPFETSSIERIRALTDIYFESGRHKPTEQDVENVNYEDWQKAVALRIETLTALAAPRDRFLTAARTAIDAMADGVLPYSLRVEDPTHPDFGGFTDFMKPTWWNIESSWARINDCRLGTQVPMGSHAEGPTSWPIFVDGEALANLLLGFQNGTHNRAGAPRISAFRKAFQALVTASPMQKTKNQAEVEAWARDEFNMGKAHVKTVRAEVFSELRKKGIIHSWDMSGRPRQTH